MKKLFLAVFLMVLTAMVIFLVKEFAGNKKKDVVISPLTVKSVKKNQKETVFLFVPYWTITENTIDASAYDGVIYFGIVPDENGIDLAGEEYKKLQDFLKKTRHIKRKFLTIQMNDSEFNSKVLQDKNLEDKIITKSLDLAGQNGFDGIVLDFEMSGLPFKSLTQSITQFYADFAKTAHDEKLSFFSTIYGDVFYRIRPYNVSDIARVSDGIMIMAYDFHKASGDPGANFPLSSGKNEDYDFKKMTDDFLQSVPSSKITVIFGMFGHDWKVNEKNQSIENAKSLTLNEIKQKFPDNCLFQDCKITRDNLSAETEITYTDSDKILHDIWFEDMNSMAKKKEFLKSREVFSTAFWAYSYF